MQVHVPHRPQCKRRGTAGILLTGIGSGSPRASDPRVPPTSATGRFADGVEVIPSMSSNTCVDNLSRALPTASDSDSMLVKGRDAMVSTLPARERERLRRLTGLTGRASLLDDISWVVERLLHMCVRLCNHVIRAAISQ